MINLEDITLYESMNASQLIDFDIDALETLQSIQDDYNEDLRY